MVPMPMVCVCVCLCEERTREREVRICILNASTSDYESHKQTLITNITLGLLCMHEDPIM